MTIRGARSEIEQAVLAWAGVSSHPHQFGGTEYRIGNREIGHIHGDHLVDIPFPTAVRNEVVAAGLAEPHHILPNSGWISVHIRAAGDVSRAVELLKRSYDIAAKQKGLST